MIKYLIKATNEVRIETIEEVKAYQEELRKEAASKGYQLSGYSWTEKEVKAKGEVLDVYYQVKYSLVFNDLKDPEKMFDIEYSVPETTQEF